MKIAVVILNWNGKRFLEQFLPNIIEHSTHKEVDIVVADNGSTDDSVEFVQKNFAAIKLVLLDKNYGFTGGYNKALEQVQADYFILINSDVEVTDNWIFPMVELLENTPESAVCMPKLKAFHQKDHFEYAGAGGGFVDVLGYPFCRGRILSDIEKDEGQYDQTSEIFWATGACLLIKSDLYWEAGGFDDDFFAHMEEIDLCWRLKNMGYKILYCPQVTVYHVGGGTLPNDNPHKLYLNYRNNLMLLYKNLPPCQLIPVIFSRMILDGISGLMYLLGGKWKFTKAVVEAHGSFYCNISLLRKKRRRFLKLYKNLKHKEIYRGSIVFDFFVRGRKLFSQLKF